MAMPLAASVSLVRKAAKKWTKPAPKPVRRPSPTSCSELFNGTIWEDLDVSHFELPEGDSNYLYVDFWRICGFRAGADRQFTASDGRNAGGAEIRKKRRFGRVARGRGPGRQARADDARQQR